MGAWEDIERAVRAGDAARSADLCVALDEDTREQLTPAAWKLLGRTTEDPAMRRAADTVALGIAPPHWVPYPVLEHTERIVRARPRAWRDAWLRAGYRLGGTKFQTYRSLLRTGDCDPLEPDRATELLLAAFTDESIEPATLLLADPELLEHELWAPFQRPFVHGRWAHAVIALANAGTIDRDRVLDEFLAMLARAEDEHAFTHLVALHDGTLAPTAEEIGARRQVYLRLLGDHRGRVVGMAARALTRLDREQPLDGRELLVHLGLRAETEVERAVALAGRHLEREPALRAWVVEALDHPAPATQEAARELLEGWSSPWEQIERAAEAGEIERVAELCLELEEHDRARLSARSVALKDRLFGGMWTNPVPRGGQTARFALGPPIADGETYLEPPYTHLERLVRARPREWRNAWARRAIVHRDRLTAWRTLRTLIRDGLCDAPESTGLMLNALQGSEHPADQLRAFPEVLEEQIWRPFSTWDDGWTAWQDALIELSADGDIARERLLDETLAALHHHTEAGTLKTLFAFHDKRLKPTPAELATRQDGYLRLLESDQDATVGFALATALRLDRAHAVDGRDLLARIEPAIGLRAKTHAKRAVILIGRVLDRDPALETSALLDALGHPSADVQAAAIEVLERHPDPRAAGFAEDVDPSLRARLAALAVAPSVRAVAVPPARLGPRPRLTEPITPVADVEELLELASTLLEGLDDPDELERFVDGLSRFCDVPVPIARRKALLRRTKGRYNVAGLCQCWLDEGLEPRSIWLGPTSALTPRLSGLAARVHARRAGVLLSAPTHRGGFLDPAVLQLRLEQAAAIDDHDLAQALLRVPDAGGFTVAEKLAASRDSLAVIAAPGEAGPDGGDSPVRRLATWSGAWAPTLAESRQVQRWLAYVWPGRRELFFAGVAGTPPQPRTVGTIDLGDQLEPGLRTLLLPDEPLGPQALKVLALGTFESSQARLLASDIIIDAIATRRLPLTLFADALLIALRWPDRKPARLAAALEPVAGAGPLHAHELQQLLEALLARLDERGAQWIGVVDLLRRLAQDADARVADPAARAYLETLTAKSGKLAKAALAVSGDGAARSIEAAGLAA